MAYVGTSEQLSNAIVNNDAEAVRIWCNNLSAENKKLVNERDYCGRTPLQLACLTEGTSLDIVETLIQNGARLIARMQDGRTALHIAAASGRDDIIRALLKKSAANEEERDAREMKQKKQTKADAEDVEMEDADSQEDGNTDDGSHTETTSRHDFESIHMSEAATENNFDSQTGTDGFVDVQGAADSQGQEEDLEDVDAITEEDEDIISIDIEDWE